MTLTGWPVDVAHAVFGLAALWTGWRVFRTDSMVRASFLLLASFVNVGAILLLLGAQYLGLALLMMMTIEMVVMAVFMVMFMMNPAGLNPMSMVHQHGVAVAAGVVTFLAVAGVALFADFPDRPLRSFDGLTAQLGEELMGPSMLVMQGAAVTLLATMIGAVVLAGHRNRYTSGDDGSWPPHLDPEQEGPPEPVASGGGHHGGHGGHGGHEGHGS